MTNQQFYHIHDYQQAYAGLDTVMKSWPISKLTVVYSVWGRFTYYAALDCAVTRLTALHPEIEFLVCTTDDSLVVKRDNVKIHVSSEQPYQTPRWCYMPDEYDPDRCYMFCEVDVAFLKPFDLDKIFSNQITAYIINGDKALIECCVFGLFDGDTLEKLVRAMKSISRMAGHDFKLLKQFMLADRYIIVNNKTCQHLRSNHQALSQDEIVFSVACTTLSYAYGINFMPLVPSLQAWLGPTIYDFKIYEHHFPYVADHMELGEMHAPDDTVIHMLDSERIYVENPHAYTNYFNNLKRVNGLDHVPIFGMDCKPLSIQAPNKII